MANFPLTLSDLQTYISGKINDPSNARYSTTLINEELDIVQDRWNLEALICRFAVTLATTGGVSTCALSGLTGTPMKFLRVAHKGIPLTKRSKEYFDRYSAIDWTTSTGTPRDYYIDLTQSSPVIGLRPQPQIADAGTNLLVEYLIRHTSMVNPTDQPFSIAGNLNTLISPYIYGIGLEAAANILEPDPTKETVAKVQAFKAQANRVLSLVQQIYADFDLDEPYRFSGGRNWALGNGGSASPFSG